MVLVLSIFIDYYVFNMFFIYLFIMLYFNFGYIFIQKIKLGYEQPWFHCFLFHYLSSMIVSLSFTSIFLPVSSSSSFLSFSIVLVLSCCGLFCYFPQFSALLLCFFLIQYSGMSSSFSRKQHSWHLTFMHFMHAVSLDFEFGFIRTYLLQLLQFPYSGFVGQCNLISLYWHMWFGSSFVVWSFLCHGARSRKNVLFLIVYSFLQQYVHRFHSHEQHIRLSALF